jgi:hypothetical protein
VKLAGLGSLSMRITAVYDFFVAASIRAANCLAPARYRVRGQECRADLALGRKRNVRLDRVGREQQAGQHGEAQEQSLPHG